MVTCGHVIPCARYGEWVKNDYQWYSPRNKRRVRNYTPPVAVAAAGAGAGAGAGADAATASAAVPERAPGCGDSGVPVCGAGVAGFPKAWVSGDFRRVDFCCAFWRCGATTRDYKVAFAGFVLFMCLLLFAIIVGNGWPSAPWIGPCISVGTAILLTTLLPIAAWFNTFEVTVFVVASPFVSLLLHFFGLLALWQYQFDGDTNLKGAACLLALVGYPAIVVLGLALYVWSARACCTQTLAALAGAPVVLRVRGDH